MKEAKDSPFENSSHEILDVNGFPFRECRRCDGTGIHSFNLVHGNMCFNCKGSGNEIVPRARDAYIAWRKHLQSQREASVTNLDVSDKILHDQTWRVIKSITITDKPCGWKRDNGGPEIVTDWFHILEFVDGTVDTCNGNSVFRRRYADALDPTPYLAMIKAPRVKKKAGSNAA